jgi:hypothetical protein
MNALQIFPEESPKISLPLRGGSGHFVGQHAEMMAAPEIRKHQCEKKTCDYNEGSAGIGHNYLGHG